MNISRKILEHLELELGGLFHQTHFNKLEFA